MANTTSTDYVEFVVKGMEEVRNAYRTITQLQQQLGNGAKQATTAYNSFARAVGSVTKALLDASKTAAKMNAEEAKTARMEEVTKQMKLRHNMVRYLIKNQRELTEEEKAWISALLKARNALEETNNVTKKSASILEQFGQAAAETREELSTMVLSVVSSITGLSAGTLGVLSVILPVVGKIGGKIISIMASAVKTVFNAVKSVAQGIINVLDTILSPLTSILGTALGVFGGMRLITIFDNIRDAIRGLTTDVYEGVKAFQLLDKRFEAIIARDMASRFGMPFGQAMAFAKREAKELSEWVKVLATTTPYSAQVVAESLALSNAYGLNVEMAKRLTSATADFASAMGLTEDHMYRIIYNFGQMQNQGKLTGREFRDLAISFVPVYDILRNMATAADVSYEEMKKLALEGGVPVKDFFDEFINMAERDFPGAAKTMARTIAGIVENFGDFKKVILGVSVFGPVMERIANILADVLDRLLSKNVRSQFEQLGTVVDRLGQRMIVSFTLLQASVKKLLLALGFTQPTLQSFAQGLMTVVLFVNLLIRKLSQLINTIVGNLKPGMDKTADNMKTWGNNLIVWFAKGMAKGVSAIVTVITKIMNLLARFFKPKSPPDIAPYIDQWGAETATLWLEGWLSADFSVFDEFASTVEDYLRSMPIDYGGDDSGLILKILGSREAIAKAIQDFRSGNLSLSDAIDAIIGSVPDATAEFKQYIATMFAVEDATKSVADAQKELDEITALYDERLEELNRELRDVTEAYDEQIRLGEIQDAIDTGLLTNDELERLNAEKRAIELKQEIRATEEERDIAIDAADAKLQAAQELLAFRQAELENLQATIEYQIKQNELLQELLGIMESLRGGGGEEEETFTWPEDDPRFPKPGGTIQDQLGLWDLDTAFGEAQKAAEGLFATLSEALLGDTDWGKTFDELSTSIDSAYTSLAAFIRDKVIPWYNKESPLMVDAFGSLTDSIVAFTEAITGQKGANATLGLFSMALWLARWQMAEVGTIVDIVTYLIGLFTGDADIASGAIDRLRNKNTLLADVLIWQYDWWKKVNTFLFTTLPNTISKFLLGAGGTILKWAEDLTGWVGDAGDKLATVVDWIGKLAEALARLDWDAFWALIGKSPSPLAIGVSYANKELEELANIRLPSLKAQLDLMPSSRMAASQITNIGGTSYSIDRSTHVQINPTYANTQSEASIFYDITAALMAARV